MKIITIQDIHIYCKSQTEYRIRTPIGVFNDINEAIQNYPYITEHKNIRQCPICNQYFVKYGKGKNRQKYCSKECSKEYVKRYKQVYNSAWNRDKWLRDKNKTLLHDIGNREKDNEFHQDDRFWGLGESGLKEHPNKDFNKEANLIKNELYKIRNKKYNWRQSLH